MERGNLRGITLEEYPCKQEQDHIRLHMFRLFDLSRDFVRSNSTCMYLVPQIIHLMHIANSLKDGYHYIWRTTHRIRCNNLMRLKRCLKDTLECIVRNIGVYLRDM